MFGLSLENIGTNYQYNILLERQSLEGDTVAAAEQAHHHYFVPKYKGNKRPNELGLLKFIWTDYKRDIARFFGLDIDTFLYQVRQQLAAAPRRFIEEKYAALQQELRSKEPNNELLKKYREELRSVSQGESEIEQTCIECFETFLRQQLSSDQYSQLLHAYCQNLDDYARRTLSHAFGAVNEDDERAPGKTFNLSGENSETNIYLDGYGKLVAVNKSNVVIVVREQDKPTRSVRLAGDIVSVATLKQASSAVREQCAATEHCELDQIPEHMFQQVMCQTDRQATCDLLSAPETMLQQPKKGGKTPEGLTLIKISRDDTDIELNDYNTWRKGHEDEFPPDVRHDLLRIVNHDELFLATVLEATKQTTKNESEILKQFQRDYGAVSRDGDTDLESRSEQFFGLRNSRSHKLKEPYSKQTLYELVGEDGASLIFKFYHQSLLGVQEHIFQKLIADRVYKADSSNIAYFNAHLHGRKTFIRYHDGKLIFETVAPYKLPDQDTSCHLYARIEFSKSDGGKITHLSTDSKAMLELFKIMTPSVTTTRLLSHGQDESTDMETSFLSSTDNEREDSDDDRAQSALPSYDEPTTIERLNSWIAENSSAIPTPYVNLLVAQLQLLVENTTCQTDISNICERVFNTIRGSTTEALTPGFIIRIKDKPWGRVIGTLLDGINDKYTVTPIVEEKDNDAKTETPWAEFSRISPSSTWFGMGFIDLVQAHVNSLDGTEFKFEKIFISRQLAAFNATNATPETKRKAWLSIKSAFCDNTKLSEKFNEILVDFLKKQCDSDASYKAFIDHYSQEASEFAAYQATSALLKANHAGDRDTKTFTDETARHTLTSLSVDEAPDTTTYTALPENVELHLTKDKNGKIVICTRLGLIVQEVIPSSGQCETQGNYYRLNSSATTIASLGDNGFDITSFTTSDETLASMLSNPETILGVNGEHTSRWLNNSNNAKKLDNHVRHGDSSIGYEKYDEYVKLQKNIEKHLSHLRSRQGSVDKFTKTERDSFQTLITTVEEAAKHDSISVEDLKKVETAAKVTIAYIDCPGNATEKDATKAAKALLKEHPIPNSIGEKLWNVAKSIWGVITVLGGAALVLGSCLTGAVVTLPGAAACAVGGISMAHGLTVLGLMKAPLPPKREKVAESAEQSIQDLVPRPSAA
ncbi:MAG: hypothetical protein CMF50_05305 [Legionellales bacterium]|nr:hypothetical protein [Legionellales bacterium]|tara:strand:- start:108794 stop:112258 length:3465 start_codon:yes stop_codon:yes gene_type:complete